MGYVYIFTNPSFEGLVKIGATGDYERRLLDLSNHENIPYAFTAYAVYEVDNQEEIEDIVHKVIDAVDYSCRTSELRKNGSERRKEFFRISPEKAYALLKEISRLRGDTEKLTRIKPTQEQAEEEMLVEKTSRRYITPWSFRILDIPIGEELAYIYDEDNTKCRVIDDARGVEFEGERYGISDLLWTKLAGNGVPGYRFLYKGERLIDRRNRMERERAELEMAE